VYARSLHATTILSNGSDFKVRRRPVRSRRGYFAAFAVFFFAAFAVVAVAAVVFFASARRSFFLRRDARFFTLSLPWLFPIMLHPQPFARRFQVISTTND
jgi:hypothetical protein